MKFFSAVTSMQFSWDDIASGVFRRYPNPYSKHVLSEDVVNRYVKDGKLYTTKLITKTNSMPRWGELWYKGPRYVCVVEESIVDPALKTFTTYTRNISMAKFLSCTEKCVFAASSEQTVDVEKSCWLNSTLGYGLSKPVLEFAIKRYKSNQHKAVRGLEHVLQDVQPSSFVQRVKLSKDKLAETAKHSKEKITVTAKHSKEKLAETAKQSREKISEKARSASVLASTPEV